jgi:hypothetical protein
MPVSLGEKADDLAGHIDAADRGQRPPARHGVDLQDNIPVAARTRQ